jgi:hypothetical protein
LIKSFSNRPEQGAAEAEQALELARNMPQALSAKAAASCSPGLQRGNGMTRRPFASPPDPAADPWMYGIGAVKLHFGDYEDAAKWLIQSVVANPNFSIFPFQPRAEAEAGLALNPNFTISRFRDGAESDNPIFVSSDTTSMRACARRGCPRRQKTN